MTMATNHESKFLPFTLHLENNITITGIKYIPPTPYTIGAHRPLIVLIHGGTLTAHNFDIAPGPLTASTPADLFSIPVVAINRPDYLGSTSLPIHNNSTYHKTLGTFNHTHLFPALWREFGIPNQCTALTPLAHSLGVPGVIIAAALYSQTPTPDYPLAGIIISGWGDTKYSIREHFASPNLTPDQQLTWKKLIMLGPSEHDNAPPEAVAAIGPQQHALDYTELREWTDGVWSSYCQEFQDRVAVPVMFGLGEDDMFFQGTREHVRAYEALFPSCPRFDGCLVLGAGHAIEWCYPGIGWYVRCFGFAIEVCEVYGRKMSVGHTNAG